MCSKKSHDDTNLLKDTSLSVKTADTDNPITYNNSKLDSFSSDYIEDESENDEIYENESVGESGSNILKATIFNSDNPKEKFLHIRATPKQGVMYYHFLSIPLESTPETGFTKVYEYSKKYGLFTIDSFPLMAFEDDFTSCSENNSCYQNIMAVRNFDNLIISSDTLYYYQEKTYPVQPSPYGDRIYYSYLIGSKNNSIQTPYVSYTKDTYKRAHPFHSLCISPNREIAAYISTYDITFHFISESDTVDVLDYFEGNDYDANYLYDTASGDFRLLTYFPNRESLEEPCDKEALFGTMVWHPNSNILFFDNSGECFACIWMINITTRKVTKLIKEHEAIHPFYLNVKKHEYLFYTENNKIMRCRLPAGFENMGNIDQKKVSANNTGLSVSDFLKDFENTVNNHMDTVIIEKFLDVDYYHQQFVDFYERRYDLLLYDLFHVKKSTSEIKSIVIKKDSIMFESFQDYQYAKTRSTITYSNDSIQEVDTYITKRLNSDKKYGIDGPRG